MCYRLLGSSSVKEQIFLEKLITDLDDTISALERHQQLVFYDAVGCMLAAVNVQTKQRKLLMVSVKFLAAISYIQNSYQVCPGTSAADFDLVRFAFLFLTGYHGI